MEYYHREMFLSKEESDNIERQFPASHANIHIPSKTYSFKDESAIEYKPPKQLSIPDMVEKKKETIKPFPTKALKTTINRVFLRKTSDIPKKKAKIISIERPKAEYSNPAWLQRIINYEKMEINEKPTSIKKR